METNRQRLERLGVTDYDTIINMTDEIRCDYCFWAERFGGGVYGTPNGPIMCEGRYCDDAIQSWLDTEADETD